MLIVKPHLMLNLVQQHVFVRVYIHLYRGVLCVYTSAANNVQASQLPFWDSYDLSSDSKHNNIQKR